MQYFAFTTHDGTAMAETAIAAPSRNQIDPTDYALALAAAKGAGDWDRLPLKDVTDNDAIASIFEDEA